MRTPRPVAWILIASLALSGPVGCSTYKVKPPESDVVQKPGSRAEFRLTLHDGTQLTLHNPKVFGDSIAGRPANVSYVGSQPFPNPRDRNTDITLAIADIRVIEVRELHATKTLLLTGGVIVTALLLLFAASYESPDFSGY